jgi:putative inorganic carbon (hco3(-)) transporter
MDQATPDTKAQAAPADRPLVARSPQIIKPKHLGIAALVVGSLILGVLALYVNTTIVLAIVLAGIAGVATLVYPMLGLLAFTFLNFIRPSDWIAGLASLPLAKLVGGGTLVAVLVRYLPNRDFRYNYRQTWLLLAFAGTLYISVPFSFWVGQSMGIATDFLKTIIFYLICINVVRSVKALKIVMIVTLLCVAVLAYSVIKGYMGGAFRAGAEIGAGLFGDANDVAQVFVTVLPLAVFWNLRAPFKDLRFWAFVGFLSIAVIVTQSRGGFIGLAGVMFFMLMRGRNKLIGLVMFAVLGLGVFAVLPSQFSDRYKSTVNYEDDASSMGRIYAWKAGINMMLTRPLTGVGIGSFDVAFGQAYRPAGFYSNKWMAPHNTLVQIGGETGLIGLGLWLGMLFYCVVVLRKLIPQGTDEEKEEIDQVRDSLLIGFLGFGVTAFFLTQGLNYLFYFLIASTVCLVNINKAAAERLTESAVPVAE